jgi:hypothetical protein
MGSFGFSTMKLEASSTLITFRSFAALKDDWHGPVKMGSFGNLAFSRQQSGFSYLF